MRFQSYASVCRLFTLAVAISVPILTSCSGVNTRPPSCPPAPNPPKRTKPMTDMQPLRRPASPLPLQGLSAGEQAARSILLYGVMANYAGQCEKTRQGLIDWINQE